MRVENKNIHTSDYVSKQKQLYTESTSKVYDSAE